MQLLTQEVPEEYGKTREERKICRREQDGDQAMILVTTNALYIHPNYQSLP